MFRGQTERLVDARIRVRSLVLSRGPVQGHLLPAEQALPVLGVTAAAGRAQTSEYIPAPSTEKAAYAAQTRLASFSGREQMFWVLKGNLLICFDL